MAKRSEASRHSILTTTLRLLLEEQMTVRELSIETIAREAGVGKTTIYRWWPSKVALVIDACVEDHLVQEPLQADVPLAEALERDLHTLIRLYTGPSGRLVSQIIAEGQYDDDTRAMLYERLIGIRSRALVAGVQRAVDDGDLPPGTDPDLLGDMLYAPIYHRMLVGHEKLQPKLAKALVARGFEAANAASNQVDPALV